MMTGTWSGSSCWDVGCITDTTLSSEQKCKVRGIWWGERVCVYLCSDAPACVYQRLSDWVQQQLWQTSRAQLHWYTTHMKAWTRDLVSPVATANPGDALLKHSIGVCIVCIHLLSFLKKKNSIKDFLLHILAFVFAESNQGVLQKKWLEMAVLMRTNLFWSWLTPEMLQISSSFTFLYFEGYSFISVTTMVSQSLTL